MYKIALMISCRGCFNGGPMLFARAGGNSGSTNSHCASVKSDG
jgi:hypothetical protein